ncbi:MAG: ribonuclease Z [Myxococcales bacterium]|nr:ribonuclease Z [Myxococcales bacterium]
MGDREFVALGTASQVPTRHRNHNGYFLRWDGEGILFDPGEGTQRQLIHAGISAPRITRICVTHFHGDHCLGLAGIVQRLSLDRVPHPVHVHYPASGQRYFDRLRRASIFKDVATIVPHPIREPGVIAQGPDWTLSAEALDHTVPCFGFRLEEAPKRNFEPAKLAALGLKGPIVGELRRTGRVALEDGRQITLAEVSSERPGQVFAFVMDTRRCDGAVRLAQGADLLVCESTYLQSEATEAWERGHMTAADAAQVAQAAGVTRLVLTHFSQRHPDEAAFVAEAQPIHGDVVAVVDGMRVPVPPRRAVA